MKDDRQTVILDLQPLGQAMASPSGARGVHRVALYLFRGLVQADRYRLRFVATGDSAGAYEFLLSEGMKPEEVFLHTRRQLTWSRRAGRASSWVHRHLDRPGLYPRIARKSVATVSSFALSRERQSSLADLPSPAIFHSPLAPLPSRMAENPSLASFLTIHDLLGLSLPKFMGPHHARDAQKLLNSLRPQSRVFCVSECVKQDVLKFSSLPGDRVYVTPLAADRETFHQNLDSACKMSVNSRYGLTDDPYFLTLSSFDPRKNFGHIIRCFREVVNAQGLGTTKLVLVGSNPERNKFVDEALAQYPEVRDRIITPGFIPDKDLAVIYSNALAFLFPSFGEGFGLPVLEAMQCGTPVVCSNSTSLPEVVGDAGILLDPLDRTAWAKALLTVAHDGGLRSSLMQKGLLRAAQFSWDRFLQATVSGYSAASIP